jgi:hypothetical protein
MFRRLVVPLDGSEIAAHALSVGVQLAAAEACRSAWIENQLRCSSPSQPTSATCSASDRTSGRSRLRR